MSILTILPVNEEMRAELTGETLELIISLILQHKKEEKYLPHGGSYFRFHRRHSPAKKRGKILLSFKQFRLLMYTLTHTECLRKHLAEYEIIFQTAGSLRSEMSDADLM